MMIALIILALAGTPLQPALSIDKKCFREYQTENYRAASATCELAANKHDEVAKRLSSAADADTERFLGATLRMEAAWTNYVENRDKVAFGQATTAISVFKQIAMSKGDQPELVTLAKASLADAKKQLGVMQANP